MPQNKMKINQLNYHYLLKLIENQLSGDQPKKGHPEPLSGKIPEISAEILKILSQFTPEQRKEIMQNWAGLNLPLKKEYLGQLVELLKNSGPSDPVQQNSLIQAYSIFLKNKLPLFPSLIIGLANNYSPENPLTEKLNQLQSVPAGLIKRLTINPELPAEQISRQLVDYSGQLNRIIQLFQQNSSGPTWQLLNHLLGQQLLNKQEPNLLLALEIPLFIPDYQKLIPAYLQIRRFTDHNKRQQEKGEKDTLKISFIITLEKRGTIKADMLYSSGQLKGTFQSDRAETCRLLESQLPLLTEELSKLGLEVQTPAVELLDEKEIDDYFSALVPTGDENIPFPGVNHIDFRI